MRKELGSSFSAKGIADPRENSTPTAPKGAVASGAKPLNQPKVDASLALCRDFVGGWCFAAGA